MIELIKFLAPIAMKFITEKNKLKENISKGRFIF
jgi:hypothetical protein